jgi:hypothetical protein
MTTPSDDIRQQELARIELSALIETAEAITGWSWSDPEYGSAANISGMRAGDLMFSRRTDSNTIFARDARYGHLAKSGAWTGDDNTLVDACRRLLEAADVADEEIESIECITEFGQVANRAEDDRYEIGEPTPLLKIARARRSIGSVPVWSSGASVGLLESGVIGTLEVHWPRVPQDVIREVAVLRKLAGTFRPPETAGADVESIEAGIIHSPAIGFFMDIMPVVRVTYRGIEPGLSRRVVLYLDRHGEPVEPPRDIHRSVPESGERPTGKSS